MSSAGIGINSSPNKKSVIIYSHLFFFLLFCGAQNKIFFIKDIATVFVE